MCRDSDLEKLARDICAAAKTIEEYRFQSGSSPITFDSRSEAPLVPQNAPQRIYEAKQTIIDQSTRIQNLAIDPADVIPRLSINFQQLTSIQWLCQFHIVSCVPLVGSIRYSEAASLCSVPEDQLRRVARMAITTNFLREIGDGDELAHNAVSAAFVQNPGLADWALLMTRISMPVANHFAAATQKWGSSSRKNETAMNLAFGTDLPFFDFLEQSPELGRQFTAYTTNLKKSDGLNIRHLAASFDWAGLGDAVVLVFEDTTGAISTQLAQQFPRLRFIIQAPETTAYQVGEQLQQQPESIRSRIQFKSHGIFEPQSAQGVQIYLMRMILHDWSKEEAVKILRNIVPALRASGRDARLLIQDTVLPLPGTIGPTQEALMRVRDLTTMQFFNSKERELADYVELLNLASSYNERFVLKAAHTPPGSLMTVLEVKYERIAADHGKGISTVV